MSVGARKYLDVSGEVAQVGNSSFASKIYNLNWNDHFPLKLSDDEYVKVASFSETMQFVQKNHAGFFDQDLWGNPFLQEDFSESKQVYYREMADCFIFMKGESAYGVFIGTPVDWSSYYLRYGALLKEFQTGGRAQIFVTHLLNVLQSKGIARVETDISPANLVNIHVFNKLKFNITGVTLSERWGAMVRLTRILDGNAEKIFLDQFCSGIRPQLQTDGTNIIPIDRAKERGKV